MFNLFKTDDTLSTSQYFRGDRLDSKTLSFCEQEQKLTMGTAIDNPEGVVRVTGVNFRTRGVHPFWGGGILGERDCQSSGTVLTGGLVVIATVSELHTTRVALTAGVRLELHPLTSVHRASHVVTKGNLQQNASMTSRVPVDPPREIWKNLRES